MWSPKVRIALKPFCKVCCDAGSDSIPKSRGSLFLSNDGTRLKESAVFRRVSLPNNLLLHAGLDHIYPQEKEAKRAIFLWSKCFSVRDR